MTIADQPRAASGFRIPRWAKWFVIIGVIVFLFGAILLPNMCTPRESANRIKCAANLRAIGSVLSLYASEHGGHYPDKLSDLVTSEGVSAPVFICPSGSAEASTGSTPAEIVASLDDPKYCSYVYLKENAGKADKALVYERLEDHDKVGMNVLKGDLTVDFFNAGKTDHSVLASFGIPESELSNKTPQGVWIVSIVVTAPCAW
ncbi:hypothetical protein BH10PLA1_BH10PLA1_12780 [soil metagenome]